MTGFLEVAVVSDSPLSVVTPSGYRVEGLSLADVLTLVRGLE